MPKTNKLPPIYCFIGNKQVTEKEVIEHLNKKYNPPNGGPLETKLKKVI